jgi:hypothetical protein
LWGVAALAALLWPDHLSGPLDGIPLDGVAEAILIGLAAPILWWLCPGYLRYRAVRAVIVALLLARTGSSFLERDGWCVQFDTPKPLVAGQAGRIHAWDVRADWRSPSPQCSAVMTRAYDDFKRFPAWFFNLPPADNNLPVAEDRPPYATLDMTVRGYFDADAAGELGLETGASMTTTMVIDGAEVAAADATHHRASLAAGRHFIQIKSHLTGNNWRFAPYWNGALMGSRGFDGATLSTPSAFDRSIRGPLALIIQILAAALILGWIVWFIRWWGDPATMAFSVIASVIVGWLGAHPDANFAQTPWAMWSISALIIAVALNVPQQKQTLKGAFVLIAIPWLVYITAVHASHIGRFSTYAGGDDMWMFQRFAYKIYLQGYWLQGGEPTFWFQPFYRWIAGALHMLFGDSSMGEFWWDAMCMAAWALFAHQAVAAVHGFRWGLAAAVLCLTIVVQGPAWLFIGIGLSDIASAGFIYFAALVLMSAKLRGEVGIGAAIGAGALAAIGFFTRLNNLPMALASAAFALSLATPAAALWRPREWWPRVSWRGAIAFAATIGLALLFFAWRTYHYTGVFSLLYGTTWRNHALWNAGQPLSQILAAMSSSLMMVLTFNDPPRFAWYAIPLLFGALVAVAAVLRVRIVREVPLALAAFFLVACSAALAARGVAYAGRFSVHLLGAGCALTVCAIASAVAKPARPEAGQGNAVIREAQPRESSRSSDPARE